MTFTWDLRDPEVVKLRVTAVNPRFLGPAIDSLVGFEMALAPGFRADFRESLYRMICALTGAGITILSTVLV